MTLQSFFLLLRLFQAATIPSLPGRIRLDQFVDPKREDISAFAALKDPSSESIARTASVRTVIMRLGVVLVSLGTLGSAQREIITIKMHVGCWRWCVCLNEMAVLVWAWRDRGKWQSGLPLDSPG